jgi:hypothetical protein
VHKDRGRHEGLVNADCTFRKGLLLRVYPRQRRNDFAWSGHLDFDERNRRTSGATPWGRGGFSHSFAFGRGSRSIVLYDDSQGLFSLHAGFAGLGFVFGRGRNKLVNLFVNI